MMTLSVSQTAQNLKVKILECLNAYGIQKKQIISFTTDNANNMLAMVKLMNKDLTENIDAMDDDDDDNDNDNSENEDDDNCSEQTDGYPFDLDEDREGSESEDEGRIREVDNILDEEADFSQLLQSLQQNFAAHVIDDVHSIRCAAHTMHLAVTDVITIGDSEIKNHVENARKVAKILHRRNVQNALNSHGLKITLPRKDVDTRWASIQKMVRIYLFVLSQPITNRIASSKLIMFLLADRSTSSKPMMLKENCPTTTTKSAHSYLSFHFEFSKKSITNPDMTFLQIHKNTRSAQQFCWSKSK